jgi:hypothetical protein
MAILKLASSLIINTEMELMGDKFFDQNLVCHAKIYVEIKEQYVEIYYICTYYYFRYNINNSIYQSRWEFLFVQKSELES